MENNETEIPMTNEEVSSNQELRSDVPEGSNSVIIKCHYKNSDLINESTVGEVFLRSSPEDTKLLIENCQFNRLKKLVVPTKGLSFKEEDHLGVKQNICSRNSQ